MREEKLYYIHSEKHQSELQLMLWWGKDHKGYTTNLNLAGKYTLEEAREICIHGDSIMYDVEQIDGVAYPCVENRSLHHLLDQCKEDQRGKK